MTKAIGIDFVVLTAAPYHDPTGYVTVRTSTAIALPVGTPVLAPRGEAATGRPEIMANPYPGSPTRFFVVVLNPDETLVSIQSIPEELAVHEYPSQP